MPLDRCSINGTIVPINQAVLPATSIEVAYGFGVYEHLRVVDGIAYFLDQHTDRLFESAKIISLDHSITRAQLQRWVKALLQEISKPAYNLKILLIGAPDPKNVQSFLLPMAPLFPKKEWYTKGIATTLAHYERPFPKAKTLSMLGSYLAYRQAKQRGCYDALAVDAKGCIREGTRTNFFVVKGNTIVKPPEADVLDGVTQRIVLELAHREHIRVIERRIRVKDLNKYDGAFLTSTSPGVLPIQSIDATQYAKIPEVVHRLSVQYQKFLHECKGVWKDQRHPAE